MIATSQTLTRRFTMDITHRLAWLAGLVDGEGCVYITNSASGVYTLVLSIQMTDFSAINEIKEIVGIGRISQCSLKTKGGRTMWKWTAFSKAAGEVITQILPYLVTKKEQAQVGLQFLSLGKGNRWHPPSEEMRNEKKRLFLILRSLKEGPNGRKKGTTHENC